MDLDILDLLSLSLSASLWITEQSFHLCLTMFIFLCNCLTELVSLLLYCVHGTLYFILSWLPTMLEFGLSWFVFTIRHLFIGISATFWVCVELTLSGGEKLAQLFVVAVNIGWEGVYALFSLVYVGSSLLVSTVYQFGEVLLKFVLKSLQAITWRENIQVVGSRLRESITVLNFSEVLILGKAFVTNLFYITIGLIIVICTYYVIKLIVFKKKDNARQRRRDNAEVINETNTPLCRSTHTLRQRIPHRNKGPLSTVGNAQLQEGVHSSSGSVEDTGRMNQLGEHLLRQQLSKLNSELSQEKDKNLCVVCLDNRRELLLKPCNHYCLCTDCMPTLRKCPVCTQAIRSTEKIFHV